MHDAHEPACTSWSIIETAIRSCLAGMMDGRVKQLYRRSVQPCLAAAATEPPGETELLKVRREAGTTREREVRRMASPRVEYSRRRMH